MKTHTRIGALLLIGLAHCVAVASDSTKVLKTEVGINVLPFVALLVAGDAPRKELGVYYKRKLKRNFVVRSYIGTEGQDRNEQNTYEGKDSGIYHVQEFNQMQAYFLRAGVEKRFNLSRATYLGIGLDLIGKTSKLERHTNGHLPITTTPPSDDALLYSTTPVVTYSNRTKGIGSGLSLLLGIQLGQRVMLTFENRTNFYFLSSRIKQLSPIDSTEQARTRERKIDSENEFLLSTITVSFLL